VTATPAEIAGADQELAAITTVVDELIDTWREQDHHADRTVRISRFMITEVAARFDEHSAYAALAVAIERLALT
jgi:hypothetical protein